jgi:osmotically-inducible protein OsmY
VLKYVFLLGLFMPALFGCSSTHYQESTGEYFDSSATTTKVKTRLFDSLGSEAIAIKVKTFKKTVQLSGFVNSYEIKQRAGVIAFNTIGVKSVNNDLIIK